MAELLYGSLLVISFIYLLILLTRFAEHVSLNYVVLNAAIILINFGYWKLCSVETLEAGILANQVVYFGGGYTAYLIVLCIADLCHEKLSLAFKVGCFVISTFLVGCIMTIGKSDLYYKSIEIGHKNGYSYLIKEYGPLHKLYPAYILFLMGTGIYIVIKALRKRKKVSYITSIVLTFAMVMIVAVYFLERIFKIEYELLPFAYIIGFGCILMILRRVKHYDVRGLLREAMEETREYGCIIIDNKGRFAAADRRAREWFDEINRLDIDCKIENFDTDFLKQIQDWLEGSSQFGRAFFERGNRIIEAKHSINARKYHRLIHCIILHDDTKQQRYVQLVEKYNDGLELEVDTKNETLKAVQEDIIVSMASIVENRDSNTGGHIKRTSDVVKIFVNHLLDKEVYPELNSDFAKRITKAAPLHDFGKIAIPDIILNKPGKFTDEEYNMMKMHSEKGAVIVEQILKNSEDLVFKEVAINVAHYHHERWDGKGYPEGIKNMEIPFEARVMALADVFDALVSKRVYKDQMSYDKAFLIIAEANGTQFDPKLCKYFLECRPQLEALYDSYED